MASRIKQQRKNERESIIELLPEMLTSALSVNDDFIVTFETHPDEGKQDLHVLRGKLITPCMLGTLKNRVEIQQEEGSTIMTLHWGKSKGKNMAIRDVRKRS
jgi:hypothetical protein